MQRRLINIICLFCLTTILLSPSLGAAADVPGCHEVPDTESYECTTGPLEGREFVTRDEAQDAMDEYNAKMKEAAADVPTLPPPLPATFEQKETPEDHVVVVSWNVRALKRDGSDYDRAALVLSSADVVALQEVDLSGNGKGFLNVLANLVQDKTKNKICRGWVQAGSGERQAYAFLWKEKTVGYVDSDGEIKESCGDTAINIRQSKTKLAGQSTFFFKALKKMFVVGNMYSDSKPKSPDKHVSEVFRSVSEEKFPVLVAGDLKMAASNSAFQSVRKLGFHSAFSSSSSKKSWENFWYRGATLVEAEAIDLNQRFSDVKREEIEKEFAGIFPVSAEFTLKEKVTDSVSLVKKKLANRNKR